MSPELFQQLLTLPGALQALPAGATLFHRGDSVHSIYLVMAGAIDLLRHTADGKPVILQRAGQGDMLAEASAFSTAYHCNAVVRSPVRLHAVAKPIFLDCVGRDKTQAVLWMAHLARQTQAARLRAEILSLKTVAERLDAWLAFNETGLPVRGARLGLAHEIGVTPEALYREIARRKA